MATIKMARECAARHIPNAHDNYNDQVANGLCDEHWAVKIALDMHAMRQAEIDDKDAGIAELVECLAAAFADPMRLVNSESAMNETAALLAKHRPDAFAKGDGLIEGDTE